MKYNKLEASEGMILTNGEACGRVIYLGTNDTAANWYEITLEQYQEIMEKQMNE